MEFIQIMEKFGLPITMLVFMTWLYLRAEKLHAAERDGCSKDKKEMAELHRLERDQMWLAMKEVADKNTLAIKELTGAIREHQLIYPSNIRNTLERTIAERTANEHP